MVHEPRDRGNEGDHNHDRPKCEAAWRVISYRNFAHSLARATETHWLTGFASMSTMHADVYQLCFAQRPSVHSPLSWHSHRGLRVRLRTPSVGSRSQYPPLGGIRRDDGDHVDRERCPGQRPI